MESKYYKELQKNKYTIIIPSRCRWELAANRRGVWRYFDPDSSDYNLLVIVREEESSGYIYKTRLKEKVITVPNSSTIADKRQAALDVALTLNSEYLFIIDDDIGFMYRDENLVSKYSRDLEVIHDGDILNKILYESIELCDKEYPIVGLPNRQGAASRKYTFEKNTSIIRFVCYHVPTLVKERIKINSLSSPFMSDRFVQLALLSRGYKSLSNCRYAVDDYGTNTKGGCSETRTAKLQFDAAQELRVRFPFAVDLRKKTSGNWDEPRTDCKIRWKRFLNKDEESYIPRLHINFMSVEQEES